MREPEIAYASGRIQPFSLTSRPVGHSWNRTSPAQIRPGKGKRATNNMTSEIKCITSIYKHSNVSSK
jgi:hypothetical protein